MWSNDHIFFVYKLALYKFDRAELNDVLSLHLFKIEGYEKLSHTSEYIALGRTIIRARLL